MPFAVRSTASIDHSSSPRRAISAAASTIRCSGTSAGSPKHSRMTCSTRMRGVIAASSARARRPIPGSIASTSRGSETRRGSGRRSGIAGEISVRRPDQLGAPRGHAQRRGGTLGVAEQVHRTAQPGQEAQQRVGVRLDAVVARRERSRMAEAGQVDGQAGRARREHRGEVGPVGGRAGEPVDVNGRRLVRARRLAHVQGDATARDLAARPRCAARVERRQRVGVGQQRARHGRRCR